MEHSTRIFLAGHNGMVGSSIKRLLDTQGFENVITENRKDLDLKDSVAVDNFFKKNRPEVAILAAAKVGGIQANIDAPVDFLLENLMIQNNVISSAFKHGVEKFLFLGSSCIYPRETNQPIDEKQLLTGTLEPTNEGYAIAKIAGIKLLNYYFRQFNFKSITLLPCNLYGTNDHFDLKVAHVLSSLVKRFSDAVTEGSSSITLWGTGIAKREFMHVDDLANAVLFFLQHDLDFEVLNIGWGIDITIKELAKKIASSTNYKGNMNWDSSKPNGMLRKCLDVTKASSLGFKPSITLDEGIKRTIQEYREIHTNLP
jgi:GDP-L-fucose synthase